MLFNSPIFPIFFGVLYLLYRLLGAVGRRDPKAGVVLQNALLLVGSYVFYAWWDWRFALLILFSTAVDYTCGRLLERDRRTLWVTLSVVVNLGILAVFKYLGWFVEETGQVLEWMGLVTNPGTLELILPVGLSFYTFQSMSYTIDVYRGDTPAQRSALVFALYVSFFPQLVAGPIERSSVLIPQLEKPRTFSARQLGEGAWLIVWGFFKKLFVADNLAVVVGSVFEGDDPTSGFMVLVAAYAFTWQIYCDFSGYTDIARGVARLLGIDLSLNFKMPFFAESPREIWHRWHISLSGWLRDYLYVSLGGNRKGPLRTQLNLLLTMVLGGLWHGANWTFVAWGAYHGAALAIQRALRKPKGWRAPLPLRLIGVVLTFHFLCFGFLIFRAHDLGQVGSLTWTLLSDFRPWYGDYRSAWQLVLLICIPFGLELVQRLRGDDLNLPLRAPRWVQALVVAILVLITVVLGSTYGQTFIYFQF